MGYCPLRLLDFMKILILTMFLAGCAAQEPTEPYFDCYLRLDDVCIEGEWRNTDLEMMRRFDAH